ncbi:hypothetical protein BH23PLA1_BH23PLA1_10240 [soil metagenome]
MKMPATTIVALTLAAWLAPLGKAPAPAQAQGAPPSRSNQVYHAARIWTGDGPPIENATLVVQDGKVLDVGPRGAVEIPEAADVRDLGESSLIPGLIVAETDLADGGRDDERALTPSVRALDGFDLFGDFSRPLSGGVTTVQISPGRARLVPGRGAVVKLSGEGSTARILLAEGPLRVVLGNEALDPPRIYDPAPLLISRDNPVEPARPQLASSLADAVAGLRALFEAARERAEAEPGDFETDLVLDPLAEALADGKSLRVTARGAAEIRAAIDLARAFELDLVLIDPADLRPFLGRFDGWQDVVSGVVLDAGLRPGRIGNPTPPGPGDRRPRDRWKDATALLDAGLPVALRPSSDADLPDLLFLAGLFTAGGLSDEAALRMVTATPAEILGVADRVGSIERGKDADFVVLSRDPFDIHCRVLEVYVDGHRAFEAEPEQVRKVTVIRGSALHTGNGEVIPEASIVIEGKTIRGLGPDISAPIDAEVRTFRGGVIVPGFLDLATDLGLGGPLSAPTGGGGGGSDDDESSSGPGGGGGAGSSGPRISLQTKLGERLVSGDPAMAFAREGGVNTVLTGPRGHDPGPVIAFKLGDEPTVIRDPVALRFTLGGNVNASAATLRRTLNQGKTYADRWTKYEADQAEYEQKLKEYEAAKARAEAEQRAAEARQRAEQARSRSEDEEEKDASEEKPEPVEDKPDPEEKKGEDPSSEQEKDEEDEKGEEKDKPEALTDDEPKLPEEPKAPEKPSTSAALEPYRALFAGEVPALVAADRLDAIKAAIEVFRDEFDLPTVLLGASDAHRAADLLAEKGVSVVAGPELIRTVDREPVNLPQILANRRVPFGFQSEASTGVKLLPMAITYAVRQGLGTADALSALTNQPAGFLKIDDRVGTLAVGKDADLVIYSGPPFELSSRVLAVMIDGEWVFEDQDEDDR